MKVVINETQYNKLFNKTKTKLILTESQFKKLMVEEDLKKSFDEIAKYDKILITKENGDELHFKVTDSISGQLMLLNLDNGVYKNQKFIITTSDLNNHNLKYVSTKDPQAEAKDKDKWDSNTFRNIKRFSVFTPKDEAKFDVDVTTGKPKEVVAPEEIGGDNEIDPEMQAQLQMFGGMKEGMTYVFKLKDGQNLRFNVTEYVSDSVVMELIDGQKSFATSEGYGFEFKIDAKNIKMVKTENPDDKEDDLIDYLDVKMIRYITKDDKVTKNEVILKGVEDITEAGQFDKKEEKDNDEEGFDYNNLADIMDNDETLKNIIQSKPSAVLELIRVSKKLGVLPNEKILRKWGLSVKKGEVDFEGSEFTTGDNLTIKFIDDGRIKDAANSSLLSDFNSKLKAHSREVGVKVNRRGKGDKYVNLGGEVDGTKYKLQIIKKIGDEEDKEYLVNLVVKAKDSSISVILAEYKIKIIKSNT